MNMSPRIGILLVITLIVAAAPVGDAAAQCEVCPTTSVVAYQPVATQVVTPIDPGLINGWYPGKLLDRWAASRASYRATALTTATTAYRPVATAVPVTSYRPVTSLFSTSYMPVSVYRPVYAQSVMPTTVYSPIVASAAGCCDPCSTGSVISSYPPTTGACCGVPTAGTAYSGSATSQPVLRADEPVPNYSYQQQSQRPAAGGSDTNQEEKSRLNGETEDADDADSNETNPAGASPTGFEPPALYDPRMPAESPAPDDRTAAPVDRTRVISAIYTEPAPTRSAGERRTKKSAARELPSRAERDAGWTAVSR